MKSECAPNIVLRFDYCLHIDLNVHKICSYQINATSDSGRARLAAEKWWLDFGHELGIATQVLRLGGIYGPGRRSI